MKKNLLVVAGLAVLSTNAMATASRLDTMGATSAFMVQDTGTVYINPAVVSGIKGGLLVVESTQSGGFFMGAGNFSYGAYLGYNGNAGAGLAHTGGFDAQSNAADLFLAGDAGMKWGARLHVADSKNESAAVQSKNSAMGLGLGMAQGDMMAYANIDLSDKSTGKNAFDLNGDGDVLDAGEAAGTTADESKIKPSFNIGGGYDFGGIHYYAQYNHGQLDETLSGTTTSTKTNTLYLGAGKVHKVGATVYTSATFVKSTTEVGGAKTEGTSLPVLVAIEGEATSWLTLRGSVTHNLFLNSTKTAGVTVSGQDSTTVKLGGSLMFGKLQIDGAIGGTNGITASNTSTGGRIDGNNLFTNFGVVYAF